MPCSASTARLAHPCWHGKCKQEQRSNRAARACQGIHAEGVPGRSRSLVERMAVWTDEETTKLIELWGEEDIQVRGRRNEAESY